MVSLGTISPKTFRLFYSDIQGHPLGTKSTSASFSRLFVTGHSIYALKFGVGQKTTSAMARWHWLDGRPWWYISTYIYSSSSFHILYYRSSGPFLEAPKSTFDYFENNRQNRCSHLELVISEYSVRYSENSWFFACYFPNSVLYFLK